MSKRPLPQGFRGDPRLTHTRCCSAFWVSFAANASADPRDHLGQAWPRSTTHDIVVFGNATMPKASTVAPSSLSQFYAGPCQG